MKSDVSIIKHFGATVYDFFLVFSLLFVVNLIIAPLYDANSTVNNNIIFYTITLPLTYLYFDMSWVKGGQTLGMKAWKFHISKDDGGNITHKDALIRFITATISLVVIGILFKLTNKSNLSLQDKISKTILLKN